MLIKFNNLDKLQLPDGQSYYNILGTPISITKLSEQIKKGELVLPDDAIQYSMRMIMERDFLNYTNFQSIIKQEKPFQEQGWIRISRLPVSPVENKTYALYPRWQNAISTLHALELRLCYVLLRSDGETKLFLGAIPMKKDTNATEARERLNLAVSCQMPGIGIDNTKQNIIISELMNFQSCGAVTGIPSVRKITEYGEYQTMDQIAMGLHSSNEEKDFAIIINAEPVVDTQIVNILRIMENIGSEIHSLTQYSRTDGINTGATISKAYGNGTSSNFGINIGTSINTGIKGLIDFNINTGINAGFGNFTTTTNSETASIGKSDSISTQYISKSAMYCEELFDKHITRMKSGRNLGFWKTGIYVLAEENSTVQTVMGMLRAVYSGDDTYIEPIRTTLMPYDSGAASCAKMFHHIPYPYKEITNILGSLYSDYATPITTEELSIATSLPRRDVPGLRLVRNASRFTANPPLIKKPAGHLVSLGDMLNFGIPAGQIYKMDLNQLVKHTLIAGTNGSGKSNTCKYILSETIKAGIPFMAIEPSKDEYMRWALEQNHNLPNNKKILIFAPGLSVFDGEKLEQLHINPFQPASVPNGTLNMLAHLDRFKSALLSSLPMSDVLPLIMEEAIYAHVFEELDVKQFSLADKPEGNPLKELFVNNSSIEYPLISGMTDVAKRIIEGRQYAEEVQRNISAAVTTRISALLLGWKEQLFNVKKSTNFTELFDNRSVIINLSHLPDDKDKAIVMSILLIALWEYREAKYNTDLDYRQKADKNQLMHLTIIEEAHRLLKNTTFNKENFQGAQATVAEMFSNMLSEVRAYGEGIMLVDQVPTRLIPDAIKNTNLKIVHRLTSLDDIKSVSTSLSLREDQEKIISTLQPGEAIIRGTFDDASAWVKIKNLKRQI